MVTKKTRICLNCEHWDGDRAAQWAVYGTSAICMDRARGWPIDGKCTEIYDAIKIEIHGNATCSLEIDANFGCVLFKEVK